MNDENYVNIQGWMINRLKLKGNELILYAIIYGFSQDGRSEYFGSLRYIQKSLNISRPTVISILNRLKEKQLIEKTAESHYKVVKKLYQGGGKETLPLGGKETLPNNNNTNNNSTFLKKSAGNVLSNSLMEKTNNTINTKSTKNNIIELQDKINKAGAGYKGIEKKPVGRNARAFTNQVRARAGKPPIEKDKLLSVMTYWQKNYNLALNPLNATQRKYMNKLLETYWKGKEPKKMVDIIFKVMQKKYMPSYITPKEVFENYPRLKLKNIQNTKK